MSTNDLYAFIASNEDEWNRTPSAADLIRAAAYAEVDPRKLALAAVACASDVIDLVLRGRHELADMLLLARGDTRGSKLLGAIDEAERHASRRIVDYAANSAIHASYAAYHASYRRTGPEYPPGSFVSGEESRLSYMRVAGQAVKAAENAAEALALREYDEALAARGGRELPVSFLSNAHRRASRRTADLVRGAIPYRSLR